MKGGGGSDQFERGGGGEGKEGIASFCMRNDGGVGAE
jgi:hypothetical protein